MAKIYLPPKTVKTEFDTFAGNINNLGYQKIANTIEQFSQKSAYDNGDIFWVNPVNINGSSGYSADSSSRTLSIGSGATDKITSQTKQSFVYLAGNVHRFTSALKLNLQVGAGVEFGLCDDDNGCCIRIERESTGYKVYAVRYSSASGTLETEVVEQTNFNLDKLDGTGDSGITLDLTKIQMWHLEFSWYGGGGVAYGIEVDRKTTHFHWSSAGNRLTEFIFGDPDLPVRYHLYNKQATAGNSSVEIGGLLVAVDGSFDQRKGFNRGYVRPLFNVTSGNSYVLASIRPATTYKGKTNRAYARLEDFFVYGTADGTYTLEFTPALTSPSWTNVDVNTSMMQYDVSATGFTQGVILYCGAISSQRESDKKEVLSSKDPLTAFSDGSGTNHLSIIFNCTTNGNIGCGFNWSEYY